MNEFVLENIPFQVDVPILMQELGIDRNKFDSNPIERLVVEAQAIARPKAYYKVVPIEARGDDSVVIEGIKFVSRVLQVNLENEERVFLYAATCGTELDEWSSDIDDGIQHLWKNEIMELALEADVDIEQISLSSDSNGSMPVFDEQGEVVKLTIGDIRNLYTECKDLVAKGFSLDDVLKLVTVNPAKRVGIFQRKGSLEEGKDADLLILGDDLEIESVMAKGELLVHQAEILVKGTFEE